MANTVSKWRIAKNVAAAVMAGWAVAAWADEVGASGGYWSGRAVYRIGGLVRQPEGLGYVPFPISELDFPIGVGVGEASVTFGTKKTRIELRGGGSLTEKAGKMKDSDWLTPSRPGEVDIYSESHSDFDGLWGEGRAWVPVVERATWIVDAGGGLRYETLEYACRLIRQWSPSGRYPEAEWQGDGSVGLTYELAITMPFASAGLRLQPDARAQGVLRADVAMVQARDKDVHLQRDPPVTAKGKYTGVAIRLIAEGQYAVTTRWKARVALEAMGLYAQGDQSNTENQRWTHTIDAELEVQEVMVWAGMVAEL